MKKLILASCLFLIAISVTAAEINFLENPVWNTILEKAKREKKIIFLDGYATWCGPCKKMDSETYKDQAAAAYYNENFINVKYDMEKGEGKTLAEKYMIDAYPSLLFINENGVLLHKGVGFLESPEFLGLGKNAKDPNSQYYTLKKNALALTNAQFEKFAAMATTLEDEDADMLIDQYLAKQTDILGNENLVNLVMLHVSALPDEKMLAYFKNNMVKVTNYGQFTAANFDERMVSLALGYALSDRVQTNEEKVDFEAMNGILEKYVPEKAFFVHHYFKAQYLLDNKNIEEALTEFNTLLAQVPSKVSYDQICNAIMNMAPEFEKEGKAESIMKQFDAIKIPQKDADKAYMKDFIRVIIAIKTGQMEKFKTLANAMIAKPDVPANVKEDLKSALAKVDDK